MARKLVCGPVYEFEKRGNLSEILHVDTRVCFPANSAMAGGKADWDEALAAILKDEL